MRQLLIAAERPKMDRRRAFLWLPRWDRQWTVMGMEFGGQRQEVVSGCTGKPPRSP